MPACERASILAELTPPYFIAAPLEQTAPIVFCSPHSGRVYTRHFLAQSRLDALSLRKSEDCFVDDLFGEAALLGAPLLAARFPRAFLDANREPYELDPELFEEALPDYANTQSVRVAGGLGTIARIVSDGEAIYRHPLTLGAALERIERLYVPFHAALAHLLEATRRRFGYAILIDCHSMPSSLMPQANGPRPDFVLGDRFGASCDTRITRFVRDALALMSYDVEANRPYAGGYITEHYGRPAAGLNALQLEINRGLYLDETRLEPAGGYGALRQNLTDLVNRLTRELPLLLERRAAAE
jgi:N-formylglutamate amidohydrolase